MAKYPKKVYYYEDVLRSDHTFLNGVLDKKQFCVIAKIPNDVALTGYRNSTTFGHLFKRIKVFSHNSDSHFIYYMGDYVSKQAAEKKKKEIEDTWFSETGKKTVEVTICKLYNVENIPVLEYLFRCHMNNTTTIRPTYRLRSYDEKLSKRVGDFFEERSDGFTLNERGAKICKRIFKRDFGDLLSRDKIQNLFEEIKGQVELEKEEALKAYTDVFKISFGSKNRYRDGLGFQHKILNSKVNAFEYHITKDGVITFRNGWEMDIDSMNESISYVIENKEMIIEARKEFEKLDRLKRNPLLAIRYKSLYNGENLLTSEEMKIAKQLFKKKRR